MTDQELEVYFRQMNELFRTEGWQALLKDLALNVPVINSVEHTKDVNDLYFRKGQLNILGTLLNLEETTRMGQEESQREEQEDFDPLMGTYADV
jgi:hypothetical protein|tara:strand:- start:249 stop:530 length:282 start_codon:yes stop_codon:yes gene_type:complete